MYSGYSFRGHDTVARMQADNASDKARSASTAVNFMQCEIERLLMITEALWTILKDEHDYDDEMLVDRITEIDLKDGKLDGRVTEKKGPIKCDRCSKPVSRRRPICIYCGTAFNKDPFSR